MSRVEPKSLFKVTIKKTAYYSPTEREDGGVKSFNLCATAYVSDILNLFKPLISCRKCDVSCGENAFVIMDSVSVFLGTPWDRSMSVTKASCHNF